MQTTQKLAYEALELHNKQPYAFGPILNALRALANARLERDAIRFARRYANRYGVDSSAGDALLQLAKKAPLRHFSPGETIIKEGDVSDDLYVIQSGQVQVMRQGAGQLALLGFGQSFGEIALLTGTRRTASIVAQDYVTVFQVSRADMEHVGQSIPALEDVLWQMCRARLISQLIPEASCFYGLSNEQRHELLAQFVSRTVPQGTPIMVQGEKGHAFSVIISGHATVWRPIEGSTRRAVLAELGPGSFFGEISLLLDVPVTANVESSTPMTYFMLRRAAFDKVMNAYPEERDRIIEIARKRNEATQNLPQQPATEPPLEAAPASAPEISAEAQALEQSDEIAELNAEPTPVDINSPIGICPACGFDQFVAPVCSNCGAHISEARAALKEQILETAPWPSLRPHE